MAELTLRWLLVTVANCCAFSIAFIFIFNFAYAPWSLNPVEDLLYVRSAGFLLPANHISSALAVAGTAFYFMLRDTKNAVKWLFVITSTASIHEYVLDGLSIPTFNAANTLSYTITFRWFFWLGFILVPGVVLANKQQRKTLLMIAVFCAVYISAWILIAEYFNINTYTILAYAPGPAFHSFVPNFFEVTSWVVPVSFWWWRRWAR